MKNANLLLVFFTSLFYQGFISAIFNKIIDTKIVPEEDFIWKVSLNYRFGDMSNRAKKTKNLILQS